MMPGMHTENAQRPKVVMVEDNDSIADILSFYLERHDFEVVLLPDGRSAERHIAEAPPPNLVLLDVVLPFVDGYQLIARIRSHPTWGKVPVIMLTGNTEKEDIDRAFRAGADDYIAKPFKPEALLERLRRFLA